MSDVDAIVTWVDGSDPDHAARRVKWMPGKVSNNSVKARRFSDNDEIRYCLRAIYNHAPWIRTIWLVTDHQFPASIDRKLAEDMGVRVVSHEDLFHGFEQLLPTFNSLSIEAMLWRINGLAERFLYFNDDVVITKDVPPTAFFRDDKVVLRGKWIDLTVVERRTPHQNHKVNGARAAGYGPEHLFSPAHLVHPMLKSVMEEAFAQHEQEMIASASHRFRHDSQIWPISLHNHHAISAGRAILKKPKDTLHFSVAACRDGTAEQLTRRLERLKSPDVAMTCLNYIEAIREKVPDVMERLSAAAGPPAPFELSQPRETAPVAPL